MPTAANVRLSLLILNKLEFAVCRSPPPTMQNAESPLEETDAQIIFAGGSKVPKTASGLCILNVSYRQSRLLVSRSQGT